MALGADLMSGFTSLFSSLFNGIIQHNENLAQQDFQREMWQRAVNYNDIMWNKTNEYNTPRNQLNRLLETGLNPNAAIAALGGQTASTPATPAVPSASSTGSTASAAVSGFSAITQLLATLAQTENMSVQTEGQRIANESAAKDLERKDEFLDLTIAQMRANIDNTLAQTSLSNTEKEKLSYELSDILPEMKKKTVEERKKISQEVLNEVQQLSNLVQTGELLSEQVRTERVSRGLIYYQMQSAKFKSMVDEVHGDLARQYGLDVSTDTISMLVQLSLSGDEKARQTLRQIISTATGVASETTDVITEAADAVADAALNKLSEPVRNATRKARAAAKRMSDRQGQANQYLPHLR